MTVTEEFAGTQAAVVSTEHTLAETGGANDLTAGATYVLEVDLSNLAAGDTVELRAYVKAKSVGTAREYFVVSFSDVQTSPVLLSVPVPTAVYTKFTLKQAAGVARDFDWSVVSL